MDDQVLKMMCDYLTPVTPNPDPSLTHGGKTKKILDQWPLRKLLRNVRFYGEELLTWASASGQFNLPTCPENVRCHTNVEGFALSAMDLTSVASKCKRPVEITKIL
ncbi:hypothetical protein L3X38_036462 [Prunus dulcis]|uniref:Uncharacterized protein n=1 Tax=Prunus dulcis TaxID=3755 RepID=A0AAD4V197_PRUDU|nr:hypothetical protein L3X38_036462 [Prunus dulcis]